MKTHTPTIGIQMCHNFFMIGFAVPASILRFLELPVVMNSLCSGVSSKQFFLFLLVTGGFAHSVDAEEAKSRDRSQPSH